MTRPYTPESLAAEWRCSAGKMTDGFAAAQIAVMEAIVDDYRKLAEGERLIF